MINTARLQALASEAGSPSSSTSAPPMETVLRLFDVARRGDMTEMYAMLKKYPTIWQSKDSEGCTAMHAAASSGSMDMAQLLVQAGMGVRDADNDGWQALHYACANGHYGMAAWLLQHGADLRARTDEGWQPIHVAADTGQTQLARFLVSQGADIRAKTKTGHEVVHLATDAGALDFVQWVLRTTNGEVASAVDDDGWLPVHNAAHGGHMPLLKLYLNPPRPAKPSDLNSITSDGFTTLHLAAIAGHADAAKWLLTKGADPMATTSDGLTAERLAAISGHADVQSMLTGATTATPAAERSSAAVFALTRGPATEEAGSSGSGQGSGKAVKSVAALSPGRRKKDRTDPADRLDRLQKKWESGSDGSSSSRRSAETKGSSLPAKRKEDELVQANAEFYQGLLDLVRKTELKAAVNIQARWRRRRGEAKPLGGLAAIAFARARRAPVAPAAAPAMPAPAPEAMRGYAPGYAPAPGMINPATSRLAREVRTQAAHYIDSTLSRALLVKHLKVDLATMMEKGRVYQPRGTKSQIVAWRMRFFFCSDQGLCYQKVSRTLRPYGEKRVIPWGAITKVEALLDDSIYVETITQKKYYLKPRGGDDPATAAWTWATRLCQLTQLLGNEVAGYVAMAAYGNVPATPASGGFGDAYRGKGIPLTDDPFSFIENDTPVGAYDTKLISGRLPVPTGGNVAQAERAPMPYTDLSTVSEQGGMGAEGEGEDEDEGEETAEEAYRRRQWIIYYVSMSQFAEAEDIGWDGVNPPDPRTLSGEAYPPQAGPPAPGFTAPSLSTTAGVARGPPRAPAPAGVFYAKPGGEVVPAPAAASRAKAAAAKTQRGRGPSNRDYYEPMLEDAPAQSPQVARSTALGWLQNRMSQIGKTPSTGGQMSAGAPSATASGRPRDDESSITPLAMAPL